MQNSLVIWHVVEFSLHVPSSPLHSNVWLMFSSVFADTRRFISITLFSFSCAY